MVTDHIGETLDVSNVTESYHGNVEITNLREEMGTEGHLLVVRGDLAYSDIIDNGTPKYWLYENLLNSERIQKILTQNPNHKLFDGVGFSSLEALNYHASQIGRDTVFVMADKHYDDLNLDDVLTRYPNTEIIRAEGPAEKGYVKKQKEILKNRDDIIPMHQALNGPRALAPVGNKVLEKLVDLEIIPEETYWVMASGSNLYGIGGKIRNRFGSSLNLVEPSDRHTLEPNLDLRDTNAVREYAKEKLEGYRAKNGEDPLHTWDGSIGIPPLHVALPSTYLLMNWRHTGNTGIDKVSLYSKEEAVRTQELLKEINPEYNWTQTTALAMTPAIKAARKGKDVLVMAYGNG